jgi:IMP dehydrogenase
MIIENGYTFDDVLLVPKYSSVGSRRDVSLEISLPKGFKLHSPIVSANMKSVTGVEMARKIASLGGLGILHRFSDHKNIVDMFIESTRHGTDHFPGLIGASVGIQNEDVGLADELIKKGCQVICVDVAHGHHARVIRFVKELSDNHRDVLIIAGNVATPEGAVALARAGADVIKLGVGPGSICSTRIETGNGYPQLSALEKVFSALDKEEKYHAIIADGGIRAAGDCVKALCFSHMVMIGNLLAGTDCAPGEVIQIDGKKYHQYAGSSTHKTTHVEGVVGLVPYRGKTEDVIDRLHQGIRSGCSYQGVKNLEDLKVNPRFVQVSNAGIQESRPHDIIIK